MQYSSNNRKKFVFEPARREQRKARIALVGVGGSGKSLTALRIASGLGCKRIALICSERGSARMHAGKGVEFDMIELQSFSPAMYCYAIEDAAAAGYDALIVDGLSQAWSGKDGAREMVDRIAARSQSHNSFVAWREVTPEHNRLVDTLLSYPGHLLATCRAKTEYVIEDVVVDGKVSKVPRKIGLAPIQRDGLEYEFDIVGDITLPAHDWIITKDRTELFDGTIIRRPGVEFGQTLLGWLNAGEPPKPRLVPEPPPPPPARADEPATRQSRSRRRSEQQEPQRQTAPQLEPEPQVPGVVCFSKTGEWSGAAEWSGRPLTEAPTDVLQNYASVLVLAIDNPRNRARQRVIREHRGAVLALVQERMRAITLSTQAANHGSAHTADSRRGWDLSGEGAQHDDDKPTH
jgi:hypothetical protein